MYKKTIHTLSSSLAMGKTISSADLALKTVTEFVPGTGALYEKAKQYIATRNETRLMEYHKALLHAAQNDETPLDPDITDAYFYALLNACVSDIEDLKTIPYANLTNSITGRKLDKSFHQHFIFLLRDMSWEELDTLRHCYILSFFSVCDEQGKLRHPNDLHQIEPQYDGIKEITSGLQITKTSLISKLLIREDSITLLGKLFIEATFQKEELTPTHFGYDDWNIHKCKLILLETGGGESNREYIQAIIHALQQRKVKFADLLSGMYLDEGKALTHNSNCYILLAAKDYSEDRLKKALRVIDNRPFITIIHDNNEACLATITEDELLKQNSPYMNASDCVNKATQELFSNLDPHATHEFIWKP